MTSAAGSQAPFRITSLQCPRCKLSELSSTRIARCDRCGGAWVSDEALHERVTEMQQAPANLRWHHEVRAPLACVVCAAPMETLALFDVPVDRCHPHGVWFDADELATVLIQSQQLAPVAPSASDTPLIDGPLDVIDAVAHGPVLVDVSAGVLEAALDVLGAIFSAIDL